MSDIGTARARPLNRLEQMTYPQLELLLPPNWATRDISERRASGARTFPELGAPEAYCGAHVAQPLRSVRDSTRPSEVSSRRKPRLYCAPVASISSRAAGVQCPTRPCHLVRSPTRRIRPALSLLALGCASYAAS